MGLANVVLDAAFGCPSEFSYDFDRFLLLLGSGPPIDSVAGSTAIESTNDVDKDFFADLTHLLNQSTLNKTPKFTVPTCCGRSAKVDASVPGCTKSKQVKECK
ncbi:uncharacterized protein G2W53_033111 [Senna tora]|uniref:Uncharacterized protein n=1 Tax=Senna tora TaxID=362788 RepID=A0A834W6T0_9FABA|nr:uncharacterized protein G2W53_033111 [Senna tora]